MPLFLSQRPISQDHLIGMAAFDNGIYSLKFNLDPRIINLRLPQV